MKNLIYIILLLIGTGFTSCMDSFVDVDPDNRATVDTKDKVAKLLAGAYPARTAVMLQEMASDNADYNTDIYGIYVESQEQAFWWRDTYAVDGNDNTKAVWNDHYSAIAAANHALEAIEQLGNGADLQPYKGEAYLCRALGHFLLVTTFSKMYSSTSNADMGIPYATEPERTVAPVYERGTVADTYKKISEDIEAGIPLINDNAYPNPKYHFNLKAAYAFAARFYLYYRQYDKAIDYATRVLGNNPSDALREWSIVGPLSQNGDVKPNAYVETSNKANLMMNIAMSGWVYVHANYNSGTRYSHNSTIANNESTGVNGPWGAASNFYFGHASYSFPKFVMRKYKVYFQYTDPVQGIGYAHWLFPMFTSDETLLIRAEAYALLGQSQKAIDDVNTFLRKSHRSPILMTKELIDGYFDDTDYYDPLMPTPKKRFNPDFTIPAGNENLLHAILLFKRRITMHEGLRWHDINRYGIVIYRRTVDPNQGNQITVKDELRVDDQRRVFQLPTDVISAGLPANPRP